MTAAVLQLRNHIPVAAPARREPADGTESPLRVSLGFTPQWFHQRCGVDFSRRWHTDPRYRHETLLVMKQELSRAFPQVPHWRPDAPDDTWTLSGAYGAFVVPQLFGCTLRYAPDAWPVIETRPDLDLELVASLDPNDLLAAPLVAELDRQMDVIQAQAGPIHGYLNWQGVLNNAFNVYGQAIFLEMLDRPCLVHRFLSLICDVMIALARRVQARQRRSGFPIDQLDVSNCVMNMISPAAYREFVFPHDSRIAQSFERFGVHTCNWDATPYLDVLSGLPNVGYLDMGIMSDLRRARATFPLARRAVIYSPVRLQDASLAEIEADMQCIWQDLAPCDVVMADIHPTTPDSRVHELLAICRDLEEGATRGPRGSSIVPLPNRRRPRRPDRARRDHEHDTP